MRDTTKMLSGVQISSLDDNDDDNDEVLADVDREDYDSNDEEEEKEEPINLGLVEKPKNKFSLQRQFFPSKAGGAPVNIIYTHFVTKYKIIFLV